MKIAITGHSGRIGAKFLSSMPQSIEFIKLGRRSSDIYWKLGLLPDPASLLGVDAIVHFAWATTNRKVNFHTNIGGTIQLANLAKDLGCPFLFISSVGATSQSLYGKSKFLAERGVIEAGGQVIRLGLIRATNRYLDPKRKVVTLCPRLKNLIPVTEFDSFTKYFTEWVDEGFASDGIDFKTVTLVDDYCEFEILTNAKFKIPIHEKILGVGLSSLKTLNYRFYDSYDAFKTVTTRK